MSQDRIEKHIVLRASLARVWGAITDSRQFGVWFGMALDGPFIAGEAITGHIAPTQVDDAVAAMQKPYAGTPVSFVIDRIEPMTLFSLRWHPYAIDKTIDYSQEPMTLITFALKEVANGVELTLTETGFDNIPAHRRAAALRANEGGWTMQMKLIAAYVER
ncbi:MAG: SRPBCC family protein [Asticcacaulis sp.]